MYDDGAFGNPDGATTDIEDLMSQFITFQDQYITSGVAYLNETKRKVIVGAKGAGKTVYLRRIQAQMRANPSVITTEIDRDAPTTSMIIEFSQSFPERELTEKWMYVWKFAIIRSVVSHLLCNSKWNGELLETEKERIEEYSPLLFPTYKVPKSIYAEARALLSKYHTKATFDMYSERTEWDELEYIIGSVLRKLPPIYYFIDSIDEEYRHAPMYWLRCQKGLFYRVMRLIRKEVYGNRIHVIIAIRDNVLSSVSESEHQTRYVNDVHVKLLNWDYYTAEFFLEQKIKRLPDSLFKQNSEKSVEGWLGLKTIENQQRHRIESIKEYILRHTRLLPRDIIIVGNALTEIIAVEQSGRAYDLQREIKERMSECAKIFGNELLEICSNQINNNAMPQWAAHNRYDDYYTSMDEYTLSTSEILKKYLINLKSDRFTWEELQAVEKLVDKDLGFKSKMSDILWQNGGIGYYDLSTGEKQERFFNSKYPVFLIPKNRKVYILRSCLIDSIGIESDNWDEEPIIGGVSN